MPSPAPTAAIAAAALAVLSLAVASRWKKRSSRLHCHMKWVRRAGFKSLQEEMAVAVELAVQCGEAMLLTTGAPPTLKDGKHGIDPQTATDLANEKLVMDTISARFPEHVLIGEETVAAEGGKVPALDARPTWIVDPIDGTQNFCAGLPVAAVSIGLCVEGRPSLGVIYDPYRGEHGDLPTLPAPCPLTISRVMRLCPLGR